jgi:hypothetical protein
MLMRLGGERTPAKTLRRSDAAAGDGASQSFTASGALL